MTTMCILSGWLLPPLCQAVRETNQRQLFKSQMFSVATSGCAMYPILHWCLQGHTVQCEALSWEQHKQLPQPQTHPLPLLVSSYRFPSSSPMAELHFLHTPEESWGLYWSTSVLAFSEKGWLQLQCIHSSELTAAPAVGRKGRAQSCRSIKGSQLREDARHRGTSHQVSKRGILYSQRKF